jgi:hypothetical protein
MVGGKLVGHFSILAKVVGQGSIFANLEILAGFLGDLLIFWPRRKSQTWTKTGTPRSIRLGGKFATSFWGRKRSDPSFFFFFSKKGRFGIPPGGGRPGGILLAGAMPPSVGWLRPRSIFLQTGGTALLHFFLAFATSLRLYLRNRPDF